MISNILKYSLIVIVAALAGYAGLVVYGKVNETEAARMSGSVHLAENQADNMNRALADVSVFAGESPAGNASQTGFQSETPEIGKITNIDMLMALWEPRYDNAKASAAGYFATQQALTERINDPELKAQAREDDQRDLALYMRWEVQADTALAMARAIGTQLDDMDAHLHKLELRANFVFDAGSFRELPAAISELNAELAEFRTASETIRAVTESPFEAQ